MVSDFGSDGFPRLIAATYNQGRDMEMKLIVMVSNDSRNLSSLSLYLSITEGREELESQRTRRTRLEFG